MLLLVTLCLVGVMKAAVEFVWWWGGGGGGGACTGIFLSNPTSVLSMTFCWVVMSLGL